MRKLVVFYYYQTADKRKDACDVKGGVDVGALLFLLWCMCGLEDENCLDRKKDAGRVKKLNIVTWMFGELNDTAHWMNGEKHQLVCKDTRPYCCRKLDVHQHFFSARVPRFLQSICLLEQVRQCLRAMSSVSRYGSTINEANLRRSCTV